MRSPIQDYLAEVLDSVRPVRAGAVADYIPELARVDPDRLAVGLATVEGAEYAAGDSDALFTIQSISKPFVYALAIADRGLESVLESVDVEPSGEAFNELSLEQDSGRPLNPMINAGALVVHTLVEGGFDRILDGLSAFAGRRLEVDEAVCHSEAETAFRNRALANMLRGHGTIGGEPRDVVLGYTRQCSVLVTTHDLTMMAATLANGGVHPLTEEQVVDQDVVRQVLSVMATCGMYDMAGDWLSTVGFPAKSAVSGGIIGVLPGQLGIAAFSPRLDEHGSSVRGIALCRRLSAELGLHLMDAPQPARSTIRRAHTVRHVAGEEAAVFALHGSIQFAGAERLVRDLASTEPDTVEVVLDLTRVHSVNAIAERMLVEAVERLSAGGHRVTFVDPDGLLDLRAAGAGGRRGAETRADVGEAPRAGGSARA